MSENGKVRLPAGWAWTTIGEITEPTVDQSGPGGTDDFLYVDISSIDNRAKKIVSPKSILVAQAPSRARQHLRAGDMVVSMTRPNLNAVAMVPVNMEHAISSTGLLVLRTNTVHPAWLYYLVQTDAFISAMSRLVLGVLYPAVRPKDICSYTIPLAPRPEQHRIIAEVEKQFTRLDAGIAALERARANMKRYRASVLKAACEGRLVPTEAESARAEGRDYEPADRLLARILKERCAKWESDQLARRQAQGKVPKDNKWKEKYEEPAGPDTTDLPELPEGWMWCSLGQVFEVDVGATPSRAKKEYWNGNIPWVSSGEVAFCRIRKTRETITELGLANSSTKIHPLGTVLIGMIGEGKTRGQVAILDIPACNNQNSAAIRVFETGLPPEYVYRYLEGQYERNRQLGSGNNQPALNKSRVQEILFPLAPLAEQHRIVSELERRLSVIDELESVVSANLKRAERLRQSILKRAFEGKLVPQDPKDEPASVLLERIRAERAGREMVGATGRSPLQAGSKKRNSRVSEMQAALFR